MLYNKYYLILYTGDDFYFRVSDDLKLLDEFYTSIPSTDIAHAHSALDNMYGSFHKLLLKTDNKILNNTDIKAAIKNLELKWVDIFVTQKSYAIAVRALLRLSTGSTPTTTIATATSDEYITRVTSILDIWAKHSDAYKSEYPLFFARTIFLLLGEGNLTKATQLLQASLPYVTPLDNEIAKLTSDPTTTTAATGTTGKGQNYDLTPEQTLLSSSLAVWHLSIILTDLANTEPKPRVNKNNIFLLLSERYGNIIKRVDPKLLVLLDKIGQSFFGLSVEQDVNPMSAMFQNMLAGSAGKAK